MPMQNFVARENIEAFRRQLAVETCAERREALARLLADEDAKLAGLPSINPPHAPGSDSGS